MMCPYFTTLFMLVTVAIPPASGLSDTVEMPRVQCIKDETPECLICGPVGGDGRKLGDLMQDTQVYSAVGIRRQYRILDPQSATSLGSAISMAPQVKQLHLVIDGNVTITENCLENFTNLEVFATSLEALADESFWLNIAPGAFRTTPKLKKIRLFHDFGLTNESFLAFESIKDRVRDFEMRGCYPADSVIQLVRKFSKLLRVAVDWYSVARPCPEDMFQASSSSVEIVSISGCKPMDKLPKGMFKNMRRLQYLFIGHNNITSIEQGAFDDLISLKRLFYIDNKTKYLPDGLFNKTENVEAVDFRGNSVENLSERNFTEHAKFQMLCLDDMCRID